MVQGVSSAGEMEEEEEVPRPGLGSICPCPPWVDTKPCPLVPWPREGAPLVRPREREDADP